MSIIRVTKQKNFSIISNVALNDPNLSMKARGIWATLLSKPDDWKIYVSHLAKTCADGEYSIYAGLKELKEAGYVEHIPIRQNGKILRWEYVINEVPNKKQDTNFLLPKNLDEENLDEENHALLITDRIPLPNTDKNERLTKQKPAVAVSFENPKAEQKDTDSKSKLELLIKMIPAKHQTPLVIKFLEQKLNDGVDIEELKACIIYVKDKAKGNSSQFKSYLGKCLDQKWASGILEDFESERLKKEEIEAQDAMRAFLEAQERQARLEAQAKAKADNEEINTILNTVDITDLDKFIESPEIWKSVNSFEKKRWKKGDRYITRRILIKKYLQHKISGD